LKILAINDDGIYSPGLWAAVEALKDFANVTVVAPDREQSGVGTAITLSQLIRATEVVPLVSGVHAYAVEGTPSDSAIVALESLIEEPVDLVVSGINKGSNMGNDVFISGTMGAALQGFFRDIPALAVSVAALTDVQFGPAAQVVRLLAQAVAEGKLAPPLLLNVNLPNLPLEKIRGVSLTHLGRRTYMDVVKKGDDGRRNYYWIARERPGWVMEKGLDIWAVRRQRISITPLHTDLTSNLVSHGIRDITRAIRSSFRP
jgi:5'-nucleotidase